MESQTLQMQVRPVQVKPDLVEELFLQQQAHLGYFFEHLELDALRTIVNCLMQCQGTVILTGIGKSGIVAKKVAMTMNSCGCKALYLSPVNALHGDLGMVSEQDSVLLFSKSGESDELLHLCPALRNKGASLIAIVSTRDSRLAKACDMEVHLPVAKELCPYDLAPTTSTSVQLLFGDLVAIALMRAKNISCDVFKENHPAGQIGKRLTCKVRDLMIQGGRIPQCMPHELVGDVLVELSNKQCGCVLIVDEARHLLGIFTDGDLRRALQKYKGDLLSVQLQEVMTTTPRTVEAATLAYEAMKSMEQNQKGAITCMPVLQDAVVVGLIRLHDIVQSGL